MMRYTVGICLDTTETTDWTFRAYTLAAFGNREAAYAAANVYFDRLVAGNDGYALVEMIVTEEDGSRDTLRKERGLFDNVIA